MKRDSLQQSESNRAGRRGRSRRWGRARRATIAFIAFVALSLTGLQAMDSIAPTGERAVGVGIAPDVHRASTVSLSVAVDDQKVFSPAAINLAAEPQRPPDATSTPADQQAVAPIPLKFPSAHGASKANPVVLKPTSPSIRRSSMMLPDATQDGNASP